MLASPLHRLCVVPLLAVALSTAAADEPFLVEDIDPEPGTLHGADPVLAPTDDLVFLTAQAVDHGRELWITDGTSEGTRLLRDVCPGSCSSDPSARWTIGSGLVFSALRAGIFGRDLWFSDGTWQGTRRLVTGPELFEPFRHVGAIGADLTFFSIGRDNGFWVTDGTAAGTRRLGVQGPDAPLLGGNPGVTDGATLIFNGYTAAAGGELWTSDGTEQGTRLLVDLEPGPESASPIRLRRVAGGTVFFTPPPATCGVTTLWFTDGTAAGTVPLRGIDDPSCGQVPVPSPVEAGGVVYFIARDRERPWELWRTDGTAGGTGPLAEITDTSGHLFQFLLVPSDDAVLFTAGDGVDDLEPWIADSSGARKLADVCPGSCPSFPGAGTRIQGRFYFRAHDGEHGAELWTSEGTAAGTRMVHDACPGECSSNPAVVGEAGGRIFFVAGLTHEGDGRELWTTVAGGAGAVRLTDFMAPSPFPSDPFVQFSHGAASDIFLFTVDHPERGIEVWRSDGTPEGTHLAVDLGTRRGAGSGSRPEGMTPWDDRVLFFAHEPDIGYQPWISDGTEAGTSRLGLIAETTTTVSTLAEPTVLGPQVALFLSQPNGEPLSLWSTSPAGPPILLLELASHVLTQARLVPLGGRAVLFARSTDRIGTLWTTDGTAGGTAEIASLDLPTFSGQTAHGQLPGRFGVLGDRIYFAAGVPDSRDFELWSTDGTAAGTARVAEIEPNSSSRPDEFARLGDLLLFAAEDFSADRELWATDGTAEGTRLVADLVPGAPRGSDPKGLTTVGDRVFFFAERPNGDPALWTTDGTEAGTVMVVALPDGSTFPPFPPAGAATFPAARAAGRIPSTQRTAVTATTAGGDRFFFRRVGDPDDLWVSDGTAAGTGSLRPLLPAGADVVALWSAGDRVRLSVSGPGPTGGLAELWESDGTAAGTRRLAVLRDPLLRSPISFLAEAGGLLFFQGLHPEAGAELMALPVGALEPCSADAETLCLGGGRFAVRARWRDPRSGDEGTGGALPLPGSDRTGLFWFFQPDNVELMVKNLDAGPVNGFFWNFYGALSDVEYWIEVEDTATGRRVEYRNPEGEICGRGDTAAFPSRPRIPVPVPPVAAPVRSTSAAGAGGTACGGSAGDLCLLGGRFRVEVEWADQRSGDTGVGTAIPYVDRSGFFWFFDDENIELVVKIIDGRQVNGRFWFFYGALSDVEYTITVTDTETDQQASYHNPPGEICGRGDTAAF